MIFRIYVTPLNRVIEPEKYIVRALVEPCTTRHKPWNLITRRDNDFTGKYHSPLTYNTELAI